MNIRCSTQIFFALITLTLFPVSVKAEIDLARLAPAFLDGIARTSTHPPLLGITNAVEVFAADYHEKNQIRAGILLTKTINGRVYNHNRPTCRRFEGAVLTQVTTMRFPEIDAEVYYVITQQPGSIPEHAVQFSIYVKDQQEIVVDSRFLEEEYPVDSAARSTIGVQIWAASVPELMTMTYSLFKNLSDEGPVIFRPVNRVIPSVFMEKISHFQDVVTVFVHNKSPVKQTVTFTANVMRENGSDALTWEKTVEPGKQKVLLSTGPILNAVIYAENNGFRDQAFIGRSWGYFADDGSGGKTKLVVNHEKCHADKPYHTAGPLVIPSCIAIDGTVDQYVGTYVMLGSSLHESIQLTPNFVGLTFFARSSHDFFLQVEDIDVPDANYHAVRLPSSDGLWKKYIVLFSELKQRFEQTLPFSGNVDVVSFVIDPKDGSHDPFSFAIDQLGLLRIEEEYPSLGKFTLSLGIGEKVSLYPDGEQTICPEIYQRCVTYPMGTVVRLDGHGVSDGLFWVGDTDCQDGTVTMDAHKVCKAFRKVPLQISNDGIGSGTTMSTPAGIKCGTGGTDCSEVYASDTLVTLSSHPDSGSTFAGFSGDADCADGSVTMNAKRSCTATFNLVSTPLSTTNHPPSLPLLVFPDEGQTALPTAVIFRWNAATDPDGDPLAYTLCLRADNSNFTNAECAPIAQTALRLDRGVMYATRMGHLELVVLLIGGAVFTGLSNRRMRGIGVVFLLTTGLLLGACEQGGQLQGSIQLSVPATSKKEFSHTASNLNAGATYYWKVIATDGRDATESAVRSFTTQ